MTNSERKKLISTIGLLSISGIGRGRFHKLVKSFGSPAKVFLHSIKELEEIPGVSHSLAVKICDGYDKEEVDKIVDKIEQLKWGVLYPDRPDFPQHLLTIAPRDIPPLLFREGKPLENNEKVIAIVGTRHPTEQGRRFAYSLAVSLAKADITVVSGMAEGIDTMAHKGALDTGGKTIAVWGNSLDIVYPPSNKNLAERIKKEGAIYSEYFPSTPPDRNHFPERNRIISGLAEGVVVVEAGKKSGALITAEQALEQRRELFAVPGYPQATMSIGTNNLIKSGAKLITSIDDIFEELPSLKGTVLTKKFTQLPDLTKTEKEIINLFSDGPLQIDHISRAIRLPVAELMKFLLALELKGVVQEISGKRFTLVEE
ncbi:MAG: DNA-protecting protein DprA [FCB group bacterium]|nr:DNA-protecting protein DprA [FCB group bacterium]